MNNSSSLPSGPIKGINLHRHYMPLRGRQFRVAGMAKRTFCETCRTRGASPDSTPRCRRNLGNLAYDLFIRPRSFNTGAAGKFPGRFVEFRSGRSSIK